MSHDCQSGYDPACPECIDHDTTCGIRCGTCNERMCKWFGPEPAINTCGAHDNECQSCNDDHRCPECAIERAKARADTAWNADPDHTWIDPRNQADIDTAAEEQRDRRAYELAHLEDREEQGRYGAA